MPCCYAVTTTNIGLYFFWDTRYMATRSALLSRSLIGSRLDSADEGKQKSKFTKIELKLSEEFLDQWKLGTMFFATLVKKGFW